MADRDSVLIEPQSFLLEEQLIEHSRNDQNVKLYLETSWCLDLPDLPWTFPFIQTNPIKVLLLMSVNRWLLWKSFWTSVCFSGAAVSSRGGRGKLSRDTSDKKRLERNLCFLLRHLFLSLSWALSQAISSCSIYLSSVPMEFPVAVWSNEQLMHWFLFWTV